MVPFDVVAGGDCVISNSGSVTHLRKGFLSCSGRFVLQI